ncbi:metallophosphoesterase family protein [Bosea sp. (in: a-proteobacteria)]|uniref:metallophosphoesterase family protein n=1 Tax=Bosea sp. (in: a-proteobacteria) TaxID=1871050 RepID=UPI0025BA9AB8|nr:metallophosphoesterase family protein [Bosea sp. (in: a-proteobacteria)]
MSSRASTFFRHRASSSGRSPIPVRPSPPGAISAFYRRMRGRPPANRPAEGQAAPARLLQPRIPEGERIYAIGDIHGRADLLRQKFAAIDADIAARPAQRPTTILLGDYVDRGPQSRDVLELILQRRQTSRVVALAGNHEAILLGFLSDPKTYADWKRLGGAETLMSYGILPPSGDDPSRFPALAEAFRRAMPDAHLDFLKTLPLTQICGDFLFVHAGVRPGVPLDRQVSDDILWIRDEFLTHGDDFGAMIVHGHSRVVQPEIHANRINIDTGAYITSCLTCLVIDESELSFI